MALLPFDRTCHRLSYRVIATLFLHHILHLRKFYLSLLRLTTLSVKPIHISRHLLSYSFVPKLGRLCNTKIRNQMSAIGVYIHY